MNSILRKPATLLIFLGVVVLLAGMLLGMRYPLVGRDDFIPGIPRPLLISALPLAAFYALINLLLSISAGERSGPISLRALLGPAIGFFCLGFILLAGCLMFLNGVLDRNPPQTHQTFLLQKYRHQARGTDHFLIVQDWRFPERRVRLRVDPGTFERMDVSAPRPVNVTVSPGFFNLERIIRVQDG